MTRARVSSAPEDALHFKGAFADGWGRVTDARAIVFQFPATEKNPTPQAPALFVSIEIQRMKDGDGTAELTPPEEVLLSVQSADKATGELTLVHPGVYSDGKLDGEPDDAGGELGAVGNTFFAVKDGYQINDKTKWMTFTTSLQEKGFKPQILKRSYLPDLIGLYAYFETQTKKKFRDDMAADPTVFVVREIKQFPYEQPQGAASRRSPSPS